MGWDSDARVSGVVLAGGSRKALRCVAVSFLGAWVCSFVAVSVDVQSLVSSDLSSRTARLSRLESPTTLGFTQGWRFRGPKGPRDKVCRQFHGQEHEECLEKADDDLSATGAGASAKLGLDGK